MDFEKLELEFAALQEENAVLIAAEKLSDEDKAKVDVNLARMDEINGQIELANKATSRKLEKFKASAPVKAGAEFNFMATASAHLMGKDVDLAAITTTSGGGVLLPSNVQGPIQDSVPNVFREAYQAYGLTVLQTPGTGREVVAVLDMGAGHAVPEGTTAASTENAPDVSQSMVLDPVTYGSGHVIFTNAQLNALTYDLLAELAPEAIGAKEQAFEKAIVDAIIADTGVTNAVTLSGTTASGMTFAKLQEARRKGSKRYDRQKVIILSNDAYSAAEALLDTTGRPFLIPDVQNQELMKFLNIPVLRSDYLNGFGASKTVGLVVSLRGFRLRDCGDSEIVRHERVFSMAGKTAFEHFQTHSHAYVAAAVTKIKTSAE